MGPIGKGLGEMFGCLVTLVIIGFIAAGIFLGIFIWGSNDIESTQRIIPEIRIEKSIIVGYDGESVIKNDTIFVYKTIK
jgi:hypothetical protein